MKRRNSFFEYDRSFATGLFTHRRSDDDDIGSSLASNEYQNWFVQQVRSDEQKVKQGLSTLPKHKVEKAVAPLARVYVTGTLTYQSSDSRLYIPREFQQYDGDVEDLVRWCQQTMRMHMAVYIDGETGEVSASASRGSVG